MKYSPYHDTQLQEIRKDSCSFPLVQLIESYKKNFDKKRIELTDITFLIPVRIDSESRLQNIYYLTNYLDKYFTTNTLIIEDDKEQKVDILLLPINCTYNFLYDSNPLFEHTKINNLLIKKATTKFIIIQDTDVIVPVQQILQAVNVLRENKYDMVYPYDGSFTSVDSLSKEMFGKILDSDLFLLNENKFLTGVKRSYGGSVLIHREKYINAGMENEFFASWGPEDIERQKRMKNLGYKVKRIEGSLFHLPHDRLDNSFYESSEHRIRYMEEYLKICSMQKTELEKYIQTWPWANKNNIYASS
ncbi:MAG: galactosyltransferase-related protein [Arachidicoccus sp.]|nr:galactosyltransferase-related protein [Arachidicoccus sp.]